MCSEYKVLLDAVKGIQFYREDKATYSYYHSGCYETYQRSFEGWESLMLAGLIREAFMRTLYLSWALKFGRFVKSGSRG